MNEPLHLNGTDHLAHDRISELRSTADEIHDRATRIETRGRAGLVERTRGTVGRRLISLGSTVAGHGA